MGKGWPWPEFKFSKTGEVGWLCYNLQLCQREIATDEIQEEENGKEPSIIKCASVSALTGSVPHKMAEALQRVQVQTPAGIKHI